MAPHVFFFFVPCLLDRKQKKNRKLIRSDAARGITAIATQKMSLHAEEEDVVRFTANRVYLHHSGYTKGRVNK